MKSVTSLLILLLCMKASAHVSSVLCKVVDAHGTQVSRTERIYPRRGSQDIRFSKQLLVSVYWSYVDSPMSLYVVKSPHYPWSFGEKILSRDRISSPAGAVYELGSIAPGYRFECSQLL